MKNIFKKPAGSFDWESLGDIGKGRGDMGEQMSVMMYRLNQYSMRQVLRETFGDEQAAAIFRRAGLIAGRAFARNLLKLDTGLDAFVAQLQQIFLEERMGILRLEEFDLPTGKIVLTVGEDISCSGLPVTGETVCNFEEGMIAGILETYTGAAYSVEEIDCWANGGRVCRFRGEPAAQAG